MDRNEVKSRIDAEYQKRTGKKLGWRLLSSPWSTVNTAEVVFLGLNPGGDHHPDGHAEMCMGHGSAYESERWPTKKRTYEAGKAPLQRQVTGLFRGFLGVAPETVLAGNIVPFRSERWACLDDSKGALDFGLRLWTELLEQTRRRLVITMGRDAYYSLRRSRTDFVDCDFPQGTWGRVLRADGPDYRFVGLPHLSTYRIINRDENRAALKWALGD